MVSDPILDAHYCQYHVIENVPPFRWTPRDFVAMDIKET